MKHISEKHVNNSVKPHPDLNFEGYIKPFREISNLWWKKAKNEGGKKSKSESKDIDKIMIIINKKGQENDEEHNEDEEIYDIIPYFYDDIDEEIAKLVNKKHLVNYRPVPISKKETTKNPSYNDLCIQWYN